MMMMNTMMMKATAYLNAKLDQETARHLPLHATVNYDMPSGFYTKLHAMTCRR
jgi:hypothetical protein